MSLRSPPVLGCSHHLIYIPSTLFLPAFPDLSLLLLEFGNPAVPHAASVIPLLHSFILVVLVTCFKPPFAVKGHLMLLGARNPDLDYVNPEKELNAGIWTLYAGATAFLAARVWTKLFRRHGLWFDDYILLTAWVILTANDIIISIEYATGYVTAHWGDRMHILINITSCGTLLGQSLTKTAFAVTLLKLTRGFSHWKICHCVLWFCIVSMCAFNLAKIVLEWAKLCDDASYDVWYRLNFCLHKAPRNNFKEAGNYYNVIMDFVFAAFPWVITYSLDMKRKEKVALCFTMSLGMIIAITTAIRTEWKFNGNGKDRWYFWRNAMSNIWYSSEITGTIIVQCIPILRPLVQEIHTSLRSKRLRSTIDDVALEQMEPPHYHAI